MHDGQDSLTDSRHSEEFGPYLVYERLGIGGMATVHRAKKRGIEGFERGVALKRMLPHLTHDAEFISSFVHEARLASLLAHPTIAHIYDFGQINGVYYIAMEHVDGFDLRKLLRYSQQQKVLPPVGVVLSIMCELCEALEYAHTFVDENGHAQGIIHRDVSPSNLIVARNGHLKVIDFGIAKASASSHPLHTEAGLVKGKFGYMSPEAVVARPVGPPSDVFSAGIVAHELLTARPLFAAGTQYEVLNRIREGEIPPPSRRNPQVPASLDQVVLAALERDQERRLQTAGGFRQALEQVADEAGIRPSSSDVAEWCATITSDHGGSRASAPSVARHATNREFPRLVSPSSSSPEFPLISMEPSESQHQAHPAARSARSITRGSSGVQLAGDSFVEFDALPSGSADQLPAESPSPASVPGLTSLPAPRRARPRWRAVIALAGLCVIAAGLAAYRLTMRPAIEVAPTLSEAAPPTPALSVVRFIVQPPDSIIEIGGNETSRHSPYEARLERGMYSVAVSHAGYKRWTNQITLQDPATQTVNVALEPATALVRLSSEPAGLVAQLDGKPLGQVTPVKFETSAGPHRLMVASATRTWTHDFEAASDETYAFHALLAPPAKRTSSTATTAAVTRTTPPPPERVPRASAGTTSRTSLAREPVGEAEDRAIDPAPEPSGAKPLPKAEPALTAAAQPGVIVALPAPPRLAAPPGAPPLVPASTVTKLSGEVPAIQGTGSADVYSKICVAIDGHVTSVKIVRPSAGIAGELQRALLEWRYKPYIDEAGQPSPACFAVNFRIVFERAH
jgi:serine/threonine protein kinase